MSHLLRKCLCTPQQELEDVVEETDVKATVLSLLQRRYSPRRKWTET